MAPTIWPVASSRKAKPKAETVTRTATPTGIGTVYVRPLASSDGEPRRNEYSIPRRSAEQQVALSGLLRHGDHLPGIFNPEHQFSLPHQPDGFAAVSYAGSHGHQNRLRLP